MSASACAACRWRSTWASAVPSGDRRRLGELGVRRGVAELPAHRLQERVLPLLAGGERRDAVDVGRDREAEVVDECGRAEHERFGRREAIVRRSDLVGGQPQRVDVGDVVGGEVG